MDALQKQLEELDTQRTELIKKMEGEKPVLLKDVEPLLIALRKEIETMVANIPKAAPQAPLSASTMYLPSGLHMTDLSVYGPPWEDKRVGRALVQPITAFGAPTGTAETASHDIRSM